MQRSIKLGKGHKTINPDVLVVGAGPGGWTAATAAARRGVTLCRHW